MTLSQPRPLGSIFYLVLPYAFLLLLVSLDVLQVCLVSGQSRVDNGEGEDSAASQDMGRLSEYIHSFEFIDYEPTASDGRPVISTSSSTSRAKRSAEDQPRPSSRDATTSSTSRASPDSLSPVTSSNSEAPTTFSYNATARGSSTQSSLDDEPLTVILPPHSDDQSVRIDFVAKGRLFRLRLKPDSSSVFSDDLVVESSNGTRLDVSLQHLYTGHLEGEPGSRAFGSIRNGLFEGKVYTPNGTFYVEPAERYFKRPSTPSSSESQEAPAANGQEVPTPTLRGHSVIYSSEDVSHPYLEVLGSGCGAARKDRGVRDWMDEVSNSVVPGSEAEALEQAKKEKAIRKAKADALLRKKRSPAGGSGGGNPFGVYTSTPSYSFSQRDGHNEDIWSRNAQSRISHERKDFYPPNPTVQQQFPSSTVKRRACSLYIQTDTYLWDHIRKDSSSDIKAREEIASLVAQHIKAVNHIYENSDFNGIRGLKFIVQRLKINDSSSCDSQMKRDHNPFCSPNIDVSNFLNLNSQFNHNDFCLAYIFTYRDFSGGTLGLAWVASTSGASGGICEKYKSYTENIHGKQVQTKRSLNTGIITFVNYNSRVPPKVSELTLAHEIGHNFGSPHDYPLDCRPGGSSGNYIMYSSATSGERPNNNKFSPCSIRNISSVLQAVFGSEGKENCFQEDDGPFCGNKIVEEGEECDCGYDQKECTEQCCYPREVEPYLESDPNAKPCTRRRGAICSPSEGPCCSEQCRFERSHKLCRHESECTFESFCNGYRAACPGAPAKPNKTECNGGTQVCWRGHCVGSICQKYDLEECFLTSKSGAKSDEMCEVACQRGGDGFSCKRTSEIHQMRNISGLKLRPGSPCNDFQGYCDVFQRCRAVDAEGPLARLKNLLFNQRTLMTIKQWITTYWWACMLMGVAVMLFMAAFIKCCAIHTPSSNPKKKPAHRISDTLRRPADTLRRKRNRPAGQSHRTREPGGSGGGHGSAGPPIPLQASAPPPMAHQYPQQQASVPIAQHAQQQSHVQQSRNLMSHQAQAPMANVSSHHQVPMAQPQLVVALPPEVSGQMPGARYLPEPPPPYPGHPPALPPRPAAPITLAGPSHGYGEGRGHYNRRGHRGQPGQGGPPMAPVSQSRSSAHGYVTDK